MNKQLKQLQEELEKLNVRINELRKHLVCGLDEAIDIRNDSIRRLKDIINKLSK